MVASALQSAGIAAEVFDAHLGQFRWTWQTALGGFRVVVPGDCLSEAADILRELGASSIAYDEMVVGCVVPVWRKWLAAAFVLLLGG